MSPKTKLRVLLTTLVVICAIPLLSACTTPDVACHMRADYDMTPSAIRGFRVNEAVSVVSQVELDEICHRKDAEGCTNGSGIFLRDAPRFSDICSLARLGHEVLHAGAQHGD